MKKVLAFVAIFTSLALLSSLFNAHAEFTWSGPYMGPYFSGDTKVTKVYKWTTGDNPSIVASHFEPIETRVSVEQLLSQLSEVEREVIRLRYGFDDGVEMSLRAVGKRLGRSHDWVAKVEKAALAKLHKHTR